MKYITISDNAEVDVIADKEDDVDALLVLSVDEAKTFLVALTKKMREAGII